MAVLPRVSAMRGRGRMPGLRVIATAVALETGPRVAQLGQILLQRLHARRAAALHGRVNLIAAAGSDEAGGHGRIDHQHFRRDDPTPPCEAVDRPCWLLRRAGRCGPSRHSVGAARHDRPQHQG